MAIWKSENIILTQKGLEVLSKVQAGIGALTVSRIVTGAGRVAPSQLLLQTAVTTEKQTLSVIEKKAAANGSVIDVQVNNTGLSAAYTVNQIGVYVRHQDFPNEVLYLIAQCEEAGADLIPLPSVTPVTYNYSLYIEHRNVSALTVTVDPAASVPMATFNLLKTVVEGHTTSISALETGKADVKDYKLTGNPVVNARALFDSTRLLKVLGKTTQGGAGDPSPTNIRPITGVGQFDKKGNFLTTGWSQSGYSFVKDGAISDKGLNSPLMSYSLPYIGTFDTVAAFTTAAESYTFAIGSGASSAVRGRMYIKAPCATVEALSNWLQTIDCTVYYQSTSYPTATQVYIGFSMTDETGYHGYAVGPIAPLFEGDTLTLSGSAAKVTRSNKHLVFTGAESNWTSYGTDTTVTNHKAYTIPVAGVIDATDGGSEIRCSIAPTKSAGTAYTVDGAAAGSFANGNVLLQLSKTVAATLTDFKALLASKYAAQTPAMAVCKLAAPVTETVPISEPIVNAAGSVTISSENTLEVTFSGAASSSSLDKHKEDKENPHTVTKAQVGLDKVENTADADKNVKSAYIIKDPNKMEIGYQIYDYAGASGSRKSVGIYDITGKCSVPVQESVIGGKGSTRIAPADFLNVSLTGDFGADSMKPSIFGSETPNTAFTNCPATFSGAFYGYREVFFINTGKGTKVVVQLTESYPQAGRTWTNTYDSNVSKWYGWQENGGNKYVRDYAWPITNMGNMPPFKNEAAAAAKAYYLGFNGGQDPVQAVPAAKLTARASNISMGYDGNLWISYS